MDQYTDVLDYINGFWPQLVVNRPAADAAPAPPTDAETLIGLPKPYLIPSRREFEEMYYWDSFFMALGVAGTEHEQLVLDMTENCAHLIERFGFVPNASRYYFTSRSQPPFFTKLFRLGYDILERRGEPTADYLERMRKLGAKEQEECWLGQTFRHERLAFRGLSRYRDVNANDFNASCESGWDHSTRCDGRDPNRESGRWQSFVPVCLNSILYARAKDLEWAAETLGDATEAEKWKERADDRRRVMNEVMWSEERQFYYDCEYKVDPPRLDLHETLAGFYPLWAGVAPRNRAESVVRHWLPKFLFPGGLVTSLPTPGAPDLETRQWAHPNGWAPLQWIVVGGLERYGFRSEAQVVRRWWCDNCAYVFRHGTGTAGFGRGTMLEKYNVAHVGRPPLAGLYGTGVGFGWSNAVFADFARELGRV